MCVVSMITDYYRDKWPAPVMPLAPYQPYRPSPFLPVFPLRMISESEWAEYQALKSKAVAYDIVMQQQDCVKPDVDEWENDIEAFLILMGWLTEASNRGQERATR